MAKTAKKNGSASDVLSRVENALKPHQIATDVKLVVVSAASLRTLDSKAIAQKLIESSRETASATLASGKMVAILDEKRDPKAEKTLKKHIAKLAPDLELNTHIFACANVFSIMVGVAPEAGKIVLGFFTEADFDKTPLNWHKVISSILNVLKKEHAEDAILEMDVREKIAVIVRSRPSDGLKQLKKMLQVLKPESEQSEGEETAENVVPMALTMAEVENFESAFKERIKAFMERVKLTTDPAVLETASAQFRLTAEFASNGLLALADIADETKAKLPAVAVAA